MLRFLCPFLLFFHSFAYSQVTKLGLSDALKQASVSNPTLKVEALQLPISEQDVKKSKLYNNPIFNLQYLQLFPSSMYYAQDKSPFNGYNSQDWFQLTKKFQIFGQRAHRIRLAEIDHKVNQSDFSENRREILYQVSLKWVDAWKALSYKNISHMAAIYLDNYLESLDSANSKPLSLDQKLRLDILDDQYDLEEGKADQEYRTIMEELKLLIGTTDSFEIDLSDTSEAIAFGMDVDSLAQYAQSARHDIKGLRESTRSAEENILYQKSLKIPSPEAGFVWNPQNTIPYAGLYYTQPLPFFDHNQTEVQKAKLSHQSSKMMLDASLKRLNTEVRVAYSNYLKKKELARKFQHNLRDSERLLHTVREQSLRGKDPIVDIWEAEDTWVQTYTMYYDAFAEYRRSYVTLLYQLNLLEGTE